MTKQELMDELTCYIVFNKELSLQSVPLVSHAQK